jgi:hypothetical protein
LYAGWRRFHLTSVFSHCLLEKERLSLTYGPVSKKQVINDLWQRLFNIGKYKRK